MSGPGPVDGTFVHQIIQIAPPHKWGGCLAVVDEVNSWGVLARVSIPHNDGTPPDQAYIRLKWEDFERTRAEAIFVPMVESDDV